MMEKFEMVKRAIKYTTCNQSISTVGPVGFKKVNCEGKFSFFLYFWLKSGKYNLVK